MRCDTPNVFSQHNSYGVLIVEDSEFVNHAISNTLTQNGYACKQAFDFATASYLLANERFDFIVLDLNLPDAAGEDLVSEVLRLTKAKIIILTGETDVQSRENFFRMGILDYIVKDKDFDHSLENLDLTIQSIATNHLYAVLVVDDSRFMRKQIERSLVVRNYEVHLGIDARNAQEVLETQDISLIVLDMELPDRHGLELLREIKAQEATKKIPVMIISSNDDPEVVRSALKLGASDFIKKPFNIEAFVLKVDYAVESFRKDRAILCEQQILQEYKEAVDRSSIVSKTDPKGRITYVNEQFCQLSGYSQKELIGKPHNIVRHPDMDPAVFKEMWETILDKKPWTGLVKNRTKAGDAYYVNTVINPIIDYNGDIVEFIGLRTDVTEIEEIRLSLEQELNMSDQNFKQAYKKAQDYQQAIDHSNILSRTDSKGVITYVNKQFCDISGYSASELVGNTHRKVKHSANSPKIFKELWQTISIGKTWHGQLRNRSKNGKTYYVDSTIVPLSDETGAIVEYMAIRHDITPIVALHHEIEATQREVIYKMGEVGESRSQETGNHVKRVAEYSKLLAKLAGLGEKNAQLLYAASPMHDIGKVGIPDAVLKKPGPLDASEWAIMQTHAQIGYNILKDSKRDILKAAAIVSYRHHEKWDGSGYPNGLEGEAIHIFGRITAIADVFDALGSDRVYKPAWDLDRILALFKEERGRHFDPKLTDIFLNHIASFLDIRYRYTDA